MNWFVTRVLTDARCSLGWIDVKCMTIIELHDVHLTLDLLDTAEAKARAQSE